MTPSRRRPGRLATALALAATLAAAVARPRLAPDWAVATIAAALLVVTGVLSLDDARGALSDLGPTIAFLAALLVLADGCREAGLFEALGAAMAAGIGTGTVADWDAIAPLVTLGEPIEPRAAVKARYDELYAVYRDLEPALRPISHRLAREEHA
jgi:di/tricarboxylate transporter